MTHQSTHPRHVIIWWLCHGPRYPMVQHFYGVLPSAYFRRCASSIYSVTDKQQCDSTSRRKTFFHGGLWWVLFLFFCSWDQHSIPNFGGGSTLWGPHLQPWSSESMMGWTSLPFRFYVLQVSLQILGRHQWIHSQHRYQWHRSVTAQTSRWEGLRGRSPWLLRCIHISSTRGPRTNNAISRPCLHFDTWQYSQSMLQKLQKPFEVLTLTLWNTALRAAREWPASKTGSSQMCRYFNNDPNFLRACAPTWVHWTKGSTKLWAMGLYVEGVSGWFWDDIGEMGRKVHPLTFLSFVLTDLNLENQYAYSISSNISSYISLGIRTTLTRSARRRSMHLKKPNIAYSLTSVTCTIAVATSDLLRPGYHSVVVKWGQVTCAIWHIMSKSWRTCSQTEWCDV